MTMKHTLPLGLVLHSKGIHGHSEMMRFNRNQLFCGQPTHTSTTTTLIQIADLKENNQREVFHFPQTSDTKIQSFQAGAWWETQHFQKPAVCTVSFLTFNNLYM